jgi:hypothetical protein
MKRRFKAVPDKTLPNFDVIIAPEGRVLALKAGDFAHGTYLVKGVKYALYLKARGKR